VLCTADAGSNAITHVTFAGIADQTTRDANDRGHSDCGPANPNTGTADGDADSNARGRRRNGQARRHRDSSKAAGADRQHCLSRQYHRHRQRLRG
jgi:hypothetical protein